VLQMGPEPSSPPAAPASSCSSNLLHKTYSIEGVPDVELRRKAVHQ
jgi:hypothetical protein